MPKLPQGRILLVHEAAIACGFGKEAAQELLLVGLPPGYVASLPDDGAPSTRLLRVLDRLNQHERLRDGTDPLERWLRNAIQAAREREREEAEVFEEALRLRIRGAAPIPRIAAEPAQQLRVLFLGAQPEGEIALNPGAALRTIEDAMAQAIGKGTIAIASGWAVRPTDVQRYLNQSRPHIVHVHAHGNAKGKLLLEWEDGRIMPVPPDAMAALLRAAGDDVRLVFFAACHSEALAEAAANVIDFAVGMRGPIEEKAATQLAAAFYRAVADGSSVQTAFDQALAVAAMLGLGEQDKPKLWVRAGADAGRTLLSGARPAAEVARPAAPLAVAVPRSGPLDVFISYAPADAPLREDLAKHAAILERQSLVRTWYDGKIVAGQDWAATITARLEAAQVILLLVSSDFIASSFCYGFEMKRALERDARGEAVVIPILLRPCDLEGAPFMRLGALPSDRKPVMNWSAPDDAWTDVVQGIRHAVERYRARG